jgi:hypothetical protein
MKIGSKVKIIDAVSKLNGRTGIIISDIAEPNPFNYNWRVQIDLKEGEFLYPRAYRQNELKLILTP